MVILAGSFMMLCMALLDATILMDARHKPPYHLRSFFQVKENSLLRKLFPVKEKNPKARGALCFDYFRMIPVFAYFIIFSISFIVWLINLILNNKVLLIIDERFFGLVFIILIIANIIYITTLITWWRIAGRNDPEILKFKNGLEIKAKKEKQKDTDDENS